MSVTLFPGVPGRWRFAGGRLLVAAIAAVAVLTAGATAWLFQARGSGAGQVPPAPAPLSLAQQLRQEQCVEAAVLFHDVRWAAACTAAAERGWGNGHADCELPGADSARLYALLQAAENKCMADVHAGAGR